MKTKKRRFTVIDGGKSTGKGSFTSQQEQTGKAENPLQVVRLMEWDRRLTVLFDKQRIR